MQASDPCLVSIELKRIQTYLFAVPRLSAMVGANARLGETLRGLLCLDSAGNLTFDGKVGSLPALAVALGSSWPPGLDCDLAGQGPIDGDPLIRGTIPQDDPLRVARDTGVLSRDGGHFEAVFPSEENAKRFLGKASQLVQDRLPGVLVASRLTRLVLRKDLKYYEDEQNETARPRETPPSAARLDLPQAMVCNYDGNEPASTTLKSAPDEKELAVSQSVKERHDNGHRFDLGGTHDTSSAFSARLS